MPLNALEILRKSGVGIACDTPEYLNIRHFGAQDATTNPSLVFVAATKPEYEHLVEGALHYAIARRTTTDAQVNLAADYLLVQFGVQILEIIPGRVSVSVDPRLAYDHDAIVTKGRNLISIFEELGIPRKRVLVKIPATYPGILAAQTLEHESPPIHTNATLIFSLVQALACAQAGISVISPFIGRVKDWWVAHEAKLNGGLGIPQPLPLSQHPGILLVRNIRSAYSLHGYDTEILAAGFRTVEEIVELGRGGRESGPDMVTLPPDLLEGLRSRAGLLEANSPAAAEKKPKVEVETRYVDRTGQLSSQFEVAYQENLEQERIVLDKVPEGLDKFSADAERLDDLLRKKLESRADVLATHRIPISG